ncbi:MAG TPA: universal stress protein [Actinopolymorphaceae bacterium]
MAEPGTARRVVVGVDDSPEAARARDFAAREARSRAARLDIVRAVELPLLSPYAATIPYDDVAGAAQTWVDGVVEETRRRFPDVEVSGEALTGSGPTVLLDRSADADLLVVGSRSRSAAKTILLGSVSSAVAAHAECPVIVVRGATASRDGGGGRGHRVVVGADGSQIGHAAVEFAFEEAARWDLPLEVVYAWELEPFGVAGLWEADLSVEEGQRYSEDQVETEIAPLRTRYPRVEVRVIAVQGKPASVLAERAAGTALLVVGSRGRGGITGLLLGSVSQSVLHHADCPVAVVHRRTEDA